MRKVHFFAVTLALCLAVTASAIEPPRVIELTDGSISFGTPAWSPDGKKIAVQALEGVFVIEAKEGARPVKITDIPIANLQWLSNDELMGWRYQKISSHPPIRLGQTYRIKTSGEVQLIWEGWPLQPPFRTSTGTIWYDSAGVLTSGTPIPDKLAAATSDEYRLENHYPQTRVGGQLLHEDTDLWLVNVDGTEKRKLCEGHRFHLAKLSESGQYIVGTTTSQSILVLDLHGKIIARIDREYADVRNNLAAWVGHPDLSPDNTLLLFARGYDDLKKDDIFGADIYLLDIRTGQEVRVTNDQTKLHQEPLFSPDGKKAVSRLGSKLLLLEF